MHHPPQAVPPPTCACSRTVREPGAGGAGQAGGAQGDEEAEEASLINQIVGYQVGRSFDPG